MHTSELSAEDDFTYLIVYNHATPFVHYQLGLVTDWSIKGRDNVQPYTLSSDYSDTDNNADSDSDADSG